MILAEKVMWMLRKYAQNDQLSFQRMKYKKRNQITIKAGAMLIEAYMVPTPVLSRSLCFSLSAEALWFGKDRKGCMNAQRMTENPLDVCLLKTCSVGIKCFRQSIDRD